MLQQLKWIVHNDEVCITILYSTIKTPWKMHVYLFGHQQCLLRSNSTDLSCECSLSKVRQPSMLTTMFPSWFTMLLSIVWNHSNAKWYCTEEETSTVTFPTFSRSEFCPCSQTYWNGEEKTEKGTKTVVSNDFAHSWKGIGLWCSKTKYISYSTCNRVENDDFIWQ